MAVYVDTLAHYLGVLPANPQVVNYGNPVISDTMNWVKISGVFTAQGNEQYLTLGNFKNDANTDTIHTNSNEFFCGYYIDDVSVIPLDSMPLKADAGPDATIVLGDSVFIGSLTNGIPNITWYNSAGTLIDTGRPGFYVHPTSRTFYVIAQTVCGYTSRDTVNVFVNLFPLKWLNFTCTKINNKSVDLNWKTAKEENVSHFSVQRSSNGRDFINVGTIPANNKPNNSYDFVDVPIGREKLQTWYYKIASIDKDGKHSYSATRKVSFDSELTTVNIYPNPAKTIVNIVCKKMQKVEITDLFGRNVFTKVPGNTDRCQIDISTLPKGLFFVKIITTRHVVDIQKLVIE